MRDHEPKVFTDLRSQHFSYSWEGLAVAEYWPQINGSLTLQVHVGMMRLITSNVANGHTVMAARASSLIFAIAATIFGIILTKNLDSKRYVVEQ